jgi:xylulokinase
VTEQALLGVDLGTSGVKAILLGVDGRPLGEAAAGYPVDSPHPGWAETDPPAWWRAVVTAVRAARDQAAGAQVAAVGLDGQMHGLVLTDAAGQPLRPALLWADARAVEETAAWRRLPEPRRAALANPIVPGMAGPLLRWVARHEPQTYRRARWALQPKDWIRHQLTGAAATDPSDASATLLWDLPADRWAVDVAAAVGLEPELLPPVVASGDPAGGLRPDAAKALGLPAGIPVAAGAADTAAALLATGLSDPAEVQLSVGTGGQIVRPVPRPAPASSPRTHLYRAAAPDRWYAMAAVQNAGLALDWVRRTLRASWSELYGAARTGPPGAAGVTFVPYLSGERTPVLRPDARGAWVGLGGRPHRAAAGRRRGGGVRAPPRAGSVARQPARPAPAGGRRQSRPTVPAAAGRCPSGRAAAARGAQRLRDRRGAAGCRGRPAAAAPHPAQRRRADRPLGTIGRLRPRVRPLRGNRPPHPGKVSVTQPSPLPPQPSRRSSQARPGTADGRDGRI